MCEIIVKRTRLCYWIAHLAKPGVQTSDTIWVCFTVILHTPRHSSFYHTYMVYTRNWDGSWLVNLIYLYLHSFQIHNLLHCFDKSWWNMPFKETWHGDYGDDMATMATVQQMVLLLSCYDCDCTQHHYKQRVLMHGHQGWNVRHGLCHIYMIYVYIWVVYSFCLFCCLFIFVTTQFVALYKPCKPKPKPSTYDPPGQPPPGRDPNSDI